MERGEKDEAGGDALAGEGGGGVGERCGTMRSRSASQNALGTAADKVTKRLWYVVL
jgi:hypothetical protein